MSRARKPVVPQAAPDKRLAWNGVRLDVPRDWEPTRLGRDSLFFEDERGPALEMKWTFAPNALSLDKALGRLARAAGVNVASGETSRDADRQWRLFAWSGPASSGRGALARRNDGGALTFFRFHRRPGVAETAQESLDQAVLASFDDADSGPDRLFEIYGLRTRVPKTHVLSRFTFQPGLFELEFSGRRELLTYGRQAPADAILGEGGLATWARRAFGGERRAPRVEETTRDGQPAVSLLAGPRPNGPLYLPTRLWTGLSRHKLFLRGLAWTRANAILSLTARGARPMSPETLETLCRRHETV